MNNVNMGGMNPALAGGPISGGPMPMMPNHPLAAPGQKTENHRSALNTYIYEYFLREGMYDCARAILKSDNNNINLSGSKDSPNSRRDENGNLLGNGVGDDPMDTDSKDGLDMKRPADLPAPNLPVGSDSCILFEWFCLFWDMMVAQRNKREVPPAISQYVSHTQHQSRLRQSQQQELLRSMRPDGSMFNQNPMMRNMQNGMPMNAKQPNLARTAMANNQNNPQAMHMLQQAKQNQMQRDPSGMDGGQNRPASPGGPENAPSPSKRPRLEGNQPFNPQQGAMMPNGQRPQQGMPGQQVGNNGPNTTAAQAQQMLIANGINPSSLTPTQFNAFQNQPPQAQQKSIQTYSQNLQQHHGQQMPNKPMPNGPGGPQGQGSPMMATGPDGAALNNFYNPGEIGGPGGMRPGPGGAQGPAGGSNHALQDYQMQLMLLEQQNKKRLMMARQEQDSMGGNMPRADGPGGPGAAPGPNGQPFQNTSPEAGRTGASPNPAEPMKRGTPQMNPAGIPSPLPEGAQSRGSPNPMGFIPNNMDPTMQQQFFKGMNGMDGTMMAAAQMNGAGMRPPSSHPNQPFNGQMNQQQMMAARQQGAAGAPGIQQWQGPNGNAMAPQGPQGQQIQGTPQQRSMPPPSAPAATGNGANTRTAESSPAQNTPAPPTPQQSNKAAPKKEKSKSTKKAAQKKSNQAAAAATPASESAQDAEPPTPATPITPVNPQSFKGGQNAGAAQPAANAPATAPAPAPAPAAAPQAHPDSQQMNSFQMDNSGAIDFNMNMDFTNPLTTDNVLQDFDFDSFLHEDTDTNTFDFNPATFGMDGAPEIGAE